MRIHYILKDNSIDDFVVEPSEPLLFNVYPQDYGYMVNHSSDNLSKNKIIMALKVIQQRKKENLEAYQIKSLTQNFIKKVSELGLTLDELSQIAKNPYVDPITKGDKDGINRYTKQHNPNKSSFTISYWT